MLPQRDQRGVTFLELIVVMGVFSLLVGISVTVYQGMRKNVVLQNTALEVVDALRTAQTLARTSQDNRNHTVQLETDKYGLYYNSAYVRQQAYGLGVSSAGGVQAITFTRLTGETTSPETVVLDGPGGRTKTITIAVNGAITLL